MLYCLARLTKLVVVRSRDKGGEGHTTRSGHHLKQLQATRPEAADRSLASREEVRMRMIRTATLTGP